MEKYEKYILNRKLIFEKYAGDESASSRTFYPKITVIIACYNIEKYIARCIESVMAQTYQNLEILITDDGSTDSSGDICDKYAALDNRIKVFHTKNHGLGPARNYAMDRMSGDFLTFVDGDDYIVPRMYEEMMLAIEEFDSDIAVAAYECVPDVLKSQDRIDVNNDTLKIYSNSNDANAKTQSGDKVSSVTISQNIDTGKEHNEELCQTDLAVMDSGELLTALVSEDEKYVVQNCAWNKLYKKELIEDLRFPAQLYEDIVYTTKLLTKVKKGVVLCDKLYMYVVDRKDSIMNTGVRWEILNHQIPSYKERGEILKKAGRDDLYYIHYYMVYKKLLLLYTQARRSKDFEKKEKMKALAKVIRNARDEFDSLYNCPIAKKGEELRMKLFLMNPFLYDVFMDLNDGIVIPMKQKIRNK